MPSGTIVSGFTPSIVGAPLLADNGSLTLAVWTEYTQPGGSGPVAVWATLQNGRQVDGGILGAYDTQGARLMTFGTQFIVTFTSVFLSPGLSDPTFVFDGTAWSVLPGGNPVISGGLVMGAGEGGGGTQAWTYDGTSSSGPALVSATTFGALGGDGAGGFGLVLLDTSSLANQPVHFLTWSEGAWSTDSVITSVAPPTGFGVDNLRLANDGRNWCLAYLVQGAVSAWMGGAGSWTPHAFAGGAYSFELGTNAGGFALGANSGSHLSKAWASVFEAGAWTDTSLESGGDSAYELLALGPGYLFVYGDSNGVYASVYDGGAWASDELSTTGPYQPWNPSVATGPAGTEIAFSPMTGGPNSDWSSAVIGYANGAFGSPVTLTADPSGEPAVAASDGTFLAAYPDIDVLDVAQLDGGSWSPLLTLPEPIGGGVRSFSFARGSQGDLVAAWEQADLGQVNVYAARFTGGSWSAPTLVADGGSNPSVAGAGASFAIGWVDGDFGRWVTPWANGSLGSAVSLGVFQSEGSSRMSLASDGTHLMAIWADQGASSSDVVPTSATSADGVTWSAPVALESSGTWSVVAVAGGPAGIAEISAQGTSATARFWRDGGWSAGSTLGRPPSCRVAVSNSEALAGCINSTNTLDAELFSQGGWIPVPSTAGGWPFVLGTDGTDFRGLFPLRIGIGSQSDLLEADAWEPPQDELQITELLGDTTQGLLEGLAGESGSWTAVILSPELQLSQASSGGTFSAPAQIGTEAASGASLSWTPTAIDLCWDAPSPSSNGVPVLWAAPNL